jgi:hypothetical protein
MPLYSLTRVRRLQSIGENALQLDGDAVLVMILGSDAHGILLGHGRTVQHGNAETCGRQELGVIVSVAKRNHIGERDLHTAASEKARKRGINQVAFQCKESTKSDSQCNQDSC